MTQIVREVSKRLQDKIDQANSLFGKGKELVMEAYKIATEENGFSPQEAKQLLLDKITVFKKSTIYSYLPDEAKSDTGRPKGKKEFPKLESQEQEPYKGDAGQDPELLKNYVEYNSEPTTGETKPDFTNTKQTFTISRKELNQLNELARERRALNHFKLTVTDGKVVEVSA